MPARSSRRTLPSLARRTCSARCRSDFDAKGIAELDHQIRRMMGELMAAAVSQIESEGKA